MEKKKYEIKTVSSELAKLFESLEDHCAENKNLQLKLHGLPTGFLEIDQFIGGIGKGLTVIAGRPLSCNDILHRNIIEYNIFNNKENPIILHIETNELSESYFSKILSSTSKVALNALSSGSLDSEGWDRLAIGTEKLDNIKNFLLYNKTIYIQELPEICDQIINDYGAVNLISISNIQDLRTKTKYENRYAEISEISKALKKLSLDYNTRVLIGSGLNRKCEERVDKRPMLYDLRDSGTIEEDANVIMFCFNPCAYFEEAEEKIEVIVAKNDLNTLGVVELVYIPKFSKIVNIKTKTIY